MNQHDKLNKAKSILDQLRKSQLKLRLITENGYALSALVVVWLLVFLLEAGLHFTPDFRIVMLICLALVSILVPTITIFRIINDPRYKHGRYAEEYWALELGKHAEQNIKDRLLNAIQVNRPDDKHAIQSSKSLSSMALYQVVSQLENVNTKEIFADPKRKNSTIIASASLLILLLLIVLTPLSDAADRIFHPRTAYIQPPLFTLSVVPAGGWTYRGEPVTFTIHVQGDAPEEVDFIYNFDDGRSLNNQIEIVIDRGHVTFDGFPAPITYYVQSGNIESKKYRLDVVTRPQITELHYRFFPPSYTGLPTTTGRENVGDVEGLPGSQLEINVKSNKRLTKAWYLFQRSGEDSTDLDSIAMSINGQNAHCTFNLMHEGDYRIQLADEDGHSNLDPIKYRIRLLNDSYPLVRIAFPEEDVILGDNMQVPLIIEADDDYGVKKLELHFRQIGEDSMVYNRPLHLNSQNEKVVRIEELWSLAEMSLFPGDVIEYWAVVWDNDRVNGPKKSESERRLVRLPSIEEIVQEVEQTEEAGMEQAKATIEAAKELKENLNEIVEELRRNPEVDWEKQREMEAAMEQQQDIRQQVEKLANKIEDLVEKLDKHDLLTAQTLEKYKELQELIAEISTPELEQAMQKLKEAIESQDPDAIRKALEDFDQSQEEYLERIERSLSILQQLQLERKMDELVRMTEELLHEQESILDNVDEGQSEELARKQQDLSISMQILEKNINKTIELAEEAGESELSTELDSLLTDALEKNINQQMQNAGQAYANSQREKAKSLGDQSARDLAELSAGLKKSADKLKEKRKTELAGKLRRIAEELIYISSDQENLASESQQIETKSPRYRSFAGRQSDIQSALQGIITRLFAASQETFFVTPELGASLGKATEQLDRALAGYSDRNPRSVKQPQAIALGEINKSALKVLSILDELEGSSSSSGYEEMMEKLSQMASAQQGLNQQSMMMPGGEGQQQMPGAGDQFAKMAASQRALQEQMGKLGEEGKGMQEILGDLEDIAGQMGEVAGDFEDKNISERTRRLQERIVSRLLDATRSVKQQEYSRRRESKTGIDMTRKSPAEIKLDQDRERLRRDLLRAMQEGYTKDYRELIRNYFQALEKLEEK
ncbi:hypothetical protein K9N50_09135 [bacterium]|nr:hypothetical protein [bacterium]